MVGPNLQLQCFNVASRMGVALDITISPIPLTEEKKASLVSQFSVSWDVHTNEGCDFGCKNMEWPTP